MRSSDEKPVLFISHDARRTGAPLLLLNFLEWVKENIDLEFDVLLGEGGELESRFMAIAPTRVFRSLNQPGRKQQTFFAKAARRFGRQMPDYRSPLTIAGVARAMGRENYGLVYANTIAAGNVIRQIDTTGCPVISHIHELAFWLGCREPKENVKALIERSKHFIVVSDAVRLALKSLFGIDEVNMTVINGFVPTKHDSTETIAQNPSRNDLLHELGIPDNAIIVGSSGTLDWRKGPDLFLRLALEFKNDDFARPIHFLWVGGDTESIAWKQLKHDSQKAGVAQFTHYIGARSNPMAYFALFDFFALMSREDPFPLVMLEAASLGKPILCFADSGGANEFVRDDAGIVVPYLDVARMADGIRSLLTDSSMQRQMGLCGRDRVAINNNINHIAPMILSTMSRFEQ